MLGLDYLHRICKIIHTDLKPENCIVALGNDELGEIVKNGRIIKKKSKKDVENKLILDDHSLFVPKKKEGTLLDGINTEGLTQNQKKKLKKKLKKENEKKDNETTQQKVEEMHNGAMTTRDEPEKMNDRTKAIME